MSDSEPFGQTGAITHESLPKIPNPWDDEYDVADLPTYIDILSQVNPIGIGMRASIPTAEVYKAQNHQDYIGLTESQLDEAVPKFIHACLAEMNQYETISRESSKIRLEKLRKIAPNIKVILDRSAPGDYYHLFKDDRMKDVPATRGADRLRSDQAAILAIVIAGINQGWEEDDLLLFLDKHVLTNDDPKLNALQDKAKAAIRESGIRIAYSGRPDEALAIDAVLHQRHIFIPKENVDILPPEEVDNTLDQNRQFKEYLAKNLKAGESYIEPTNIQGIRSMRMAEKHSMIPPKRKGYVYAMPTNTDVQAVQYRSNEIKGALYYWLTGQASSVPAPHEVI